MKMDWTLILTALGIIAAIIIGIWQIYLAKRQVEQGEQDNNNANQSRISQTDNSTNVAGGIHVNSPGNTIIIGSTVSVPPKPLTTPKEVVITILNEVNKFGYKGLKIEFLDDFLAIQFKYPKEIRKKILEELRDNGYIEVSFDTIKITAKRYVG
jgi:hypothetical protein